MLVIMVALTAFCSLGVDLGRVQLAKTELRRAADTVARAAAAGLPTGTADARRYANQYAAKNLVDGQPLVLDSAEDIEFKHWDLKAGTFSAGSTNAVHVTARRIQKRDTAIPTLFGGLIGFRHCDITAESVAMYLPAINVDQFVPATANPFLAGMPRGTPASEINPHHNPDVAGDDRNPKQSPLAVNMPLDEGEALTFDSISGTAKHDPNLAVFNPDGEIGDIGHNNLTTNGSNSYGSKMYNENGIADVTAPINALVGVFLTDDAPNLTSAPSNLDFSTAASRDFGTLKPELKQIFFIGDGLDSKGNKQNFVVPKGATRLYLATWDFYEWNNNDGFRNIKVNRPMQIITVK
jgi:hypothetical protein